MARNDGGTDTRPFASTFFVKLETNRSITHAHNFPTRHRAHESSAQSSNASNGSHLALRHIFSAKSALRTRRAHKFGCKWDSMENIGRQWNQSGVTTENAGFPSFSALKVCSRMNTQLNGRTRRKGIRNKARQPIIDTWRLVEMTRFCKKSRRRREALGQRW